LEEKKPFRRKVAITEGMFLLYLNFTGFWLGLAKFSIRPMFTICNLAHKDSATSLTDREGQKITTNSTQLLPLTGYHGVLLNSATCDIRECVLCSPNKKLLIGKLFNMFL
jgi:hypothetical protein